MSRVVALTVSVGFLAAGLAGCRREVPYYEPMKLSAQSAQQVNAAAAGSMSIGNYAYRGGRDPVSGRAAVQY